MGEEINDEAGLPKERRPRGPYAKGVAKREEILTRTLEVIAREGYRGASLKELGEATGLTQAGLLYYFGSKENLFAEVLRKRDERSDNTYLSESDGVEGYLKVIRANADTPGLVELFSQLSVEAADTSHPAHQFFIDHGLLLRGYAEQMVEERRASGPFAGSAPAESVARIIQAVADGLQIQWLLDRSVDMAELTGVFFQIMSQGNGDSEAPA